VTSVLFIAACCTAGFFFWMLWQLPTRTLWPAPLLLCGAVIAVFAYTKRRLAILSIASVVLLSAGVYRFGDKAWEFFAKPNREWQLAENANFSIAEREAECQALRLPPLVLSMQTTGDEKMKEERLAALFQDESQLETEQGKAAAHAVTWRTAFWLRCVHVTLAQNPVGGVGFGCNPANFFRDTPAWPVFEGNLRLNPPNRAPHSVHVSVFTRLGFVGLILWLGLVGGAATGAVRTCWKLRRRLRDPHAALPVGERVLMRARFWDGAAVFCVWLLFLWAATFSVVLENPMGGFWFWSLTGVLAWWNLAETQAESFCEKKR
jgi:hypothetical protein